MRWLLVYDGLKLWPLWYWYIDCCTAFTTLLFLQILWLKLGCQGHVYASYLLKIGLRCFQIEKHFTILIDFHHIISTAMHITWLFSLGWTKSIIIKWLLPISSFYLFAKRALLSTSKLVICTNIYACVAFLELRRLYRWSSFIIKAQ